jgi:hypothetical protein
MDVKRRPLSQNLSLYIKVLKQLINEVLLHYEARLDGKTSVLRKPGESLPSLLIAENRVRRFETGGRIGGERDPANNILSILSRSIDLPDIIQLRGDLRFRAIEGTKSNVKLAFRPLLKVAYHVMLQVFGPMGPTRKDITLMGDPVHELKVRLNSVIFWLTYIQWTGKVLDVTKMSVLFPFYRNRGLLYWHPPGVDDGTEILYSAISPKPVYVRKGPTGECLGVPEKESNTQRVSKKRRPSGPWYAGRRRRNASEIRFSRSEFEWFWQWNTFMKNERLGGRVGCKPRVFHPFKPP